MDGWVDKMCCMHTVDYYSSIKKNEAPTPATMWINSKNTKPDPKDHTLFGPLQGNIREIHRDKTCIRYGCQRWGCGGTDGRT
jgi:hypothetical protein